MKTSEKVPRMSSATSSMQRNRKAINLNSVWIWDRASYKLLQIAGGILWKQAEIFKTLVYKCVHNSDQNTSGGQTKRSFRWSFMIVFKWRGYLRWLGTLSLLFDLSSPKACSGFNDQYSDCFSHIQRLGSHCSPFVTQNYVHSKKFTIHPYWIPWFVKVDRVGNRTALHTKAGEADVMIPNIFLPLHPFNLPAVWSPELSNNKMTGHKPSVP